VTGTQLSIDPGRTREILVRGPNWLGDLVMSTPGLHALRAGFPDARITLQIAAPLAPLFDSEGFFDCVLPMLAPRSGVRTVWREAARLRRGGRYDLGLCIPDSHASAAIMRLGGVRNVVGYAGRGRGPLLHHRVSVPSAWGRRRWVSRERFVLGLTDALGCPDPGTRLRLVVSQDEAACLDGVLAAHAAGSLGATVAALAPGASFGASKRWPAESFARLGDTLVRAGASVVLLGSAAETTLTAEVGQRMKEASLDLAGALSLGALKALVQRLDLMVCNDAGARHLAVAFGVPSIVFFGPTSVAKTDANLADVAIVETSDVDCRPCYRRTCPIDHRCMQRLAPEPVGELALRLLRAGQRTSVGLGV
jgi:heptosyltransferase-2